MRQLTMRVLLFCAAVVVLAVGANVMDDSVISVVEVVLWPIPQRRVLSHQSVRRIGIRTGHGTCWARNGKGYGALHTASSLSNEQLLLT